MFNTFEQVKSKIEIVLAPPLLFKKTIARIVDLTSIPGWE